MTLHSSISLRSPRETLGGYIILPRLIDKVRLHARGELPPEYIGNLLKPGRTLDSWFLTFTGLDAKQLRAAIVAATFDEVVLFWVEQYAIPHTDDEKKEWAERIAARRPDAEGVEIRKRNYPDLASRVDLASLNALDMIDMDEGRIPVL